MSVECYHENISTVMRSGTNSTHGDADLALPGHGVLK